MSAGVTTSLQRRADLSHQEFLGHWRRMHSPFARQVPGLLAYAQTQVHHPISRARAVSGFIPDGHAELIVASWADRGAAHAPASGPELPADGAAFVGASASWVGRRTKHPAVTPGPSLAPVSLPDVDVACWDTGGDGDPVVLLHAAWGSGEVWQPQLRSLAGAGFRVIAWSRRGHFGSGTGPVDRPGSLVGDLTALVDALGIPRFHLVGTAFGAFGAVAFAIARPDRLISLTAAASPCGVDDPDFVEETARLVPPAFERLPVELRELSPAYRHASPDGTREWCSLTARAVTRRVHQPTGHRVTRADLRGIRLPSLFLTGDADPYMPPARMAELAACVPGSTYATIEGAGHSPSWENPASFDAHLLSLLVRHGASTA